MGLEKTNITIVTSYPPSFFEPFVTAFAQRQPRIQLTILQRNTARAVRLIEEETDVPADLFWVSAADAFEVLKNKGLLRRIAPRLARQNGATWGYPIDDPDGYYLGFALAGYGFVYNPAYLVENRLPVPVTWSDLTSPIYSGHVGISAPSRSGTTHLIIEVILQTYGWDSGWALLSKLGGNLSTVTARSFGVASGVAQRRFGIGITIDFLASVPNLPHGAAKFILPPDTVFVPASIAILKRSRNVASAESFVDFVLSEEGQKLLLTPGINRLPVMASLVAGNQDQAGISRSPGRGALLHARRFDASLSARRYQLVNLLFDEYIVRRRATLARLWKRRAELGAIEDPGSDLATALATATRYLSVPPIPENAVGEGDVPSDLRDVPAGLPVPEKQAQFVEKVRTAIERNLAAAERTLSVIARDHAGAIPMPWHR